MTQRREDSDDESMTWKDYSGHVINSRSSQRQGGAESLGLSPRSTYAFLPIAIWILYGLIVPGTVPVLKERSERQHHLDILRLRLSLSTLSIRLRSLLAHLGIRCSSLSMSANGIDIDIDTNRVATRIVRNAATERARFAAVPSPRRFPMTYRPPNSPPPSIPPLSLGSNDDPGGRAGGTNMDVVDMGFNLS